MKTVLLNSGVARAAKNMYFHLCNRSSQSQRQSMYNDRSALHSRSLATLLVAHGAAHSAITASSVAAAAADTAVAGIHSQT